MCMQLLQSRPTLCNPMDCSPPGSSVNGILHEYTGRGCHALLQGIFSTQESNLHLLCLLHSLPPSHWGSPKTKKGNH